MIEDTQNTQNTQAQAAQVNPDTVQPQGSAPSNLQQTLSQTSLTEASDSIPLSRVTSRTTQSVATDTTRSSDSFFADASVGVIAAIFVVALLVLALLVKIARPATSRHQGDELAGEVTATDEIYPAQAEQQTPKKKSKQSRRQRRRSSRRN